MVNLNSLCDSMVNEIALLMIQVPRSDTIPNKVLTWVRFPGLPNYLYKKKALWEIGGMVGKVTKLDFNTDSRARGWYARMSVYANLDKPLISKVIINRNLQRIEYESLPVVCFSYGRYGHKKDSCSHSLKTSALGEEVVSSAETIQENMAAGKREFDP
ncbi:GroES-like zinc-binding alcohol dehydrogenase family protein [Gossypium australe]|uniref:GroES-like zinc-binding alcohol dehydrogenase family protein n=1 Tax=Gossypium australe TaxID=47621 RepID=A0A5B6UWX0_9ROSI|nr:GroES-like zinc-binding alcohol dehydrogenase family protein [Gossypium australe]